VFCDQPLKRFISHPVALDSERGQKGPLGIAQVNREARRSVSFSAILFDHGKAFGLFSKDPSWMVDRSHNADRGAAIARHSTTEMSRSRPPQRGT
ncbi:MAG TPA: hypothetical protein VNE82_16275, partial [Candidatus Binataceae bacterium]|nr:hypothetical protein [Candidatus Binataceae bacterium]